MTLKSTMAWVRGVATRPWQISVKLLVISLIVTVLAFSVVCASVLISMRQSAQELARQTLENLAATVDADVSRTIELYDHSLQVVAKNIGQQELAGVSKPVLQMLLFARTETAAHFGPLQVIDAEGRVRFDASTLDPAPEELEREKFFTVHRNKTDVGLYLSRPIIFHGIPSIVLSRRVHTADGHFAGVVAGAIRLSYFQDLFSRLRLADDDIIALLRRDGMLITRRPLIPELVGKNISQIPSVERMLTTPSGWFSGKGLDDGVSRMFVWTDNPRSMVVLVGQSWETIFRLWRKEALRLGAILLALVVFVAAVTVVLIREINRRASAERRLKELSITDPLTGLTNRRRFDSAIDEEWRRAQRNRSPIALLMIDADHFKRFNDTYGHQAGDQILIGIALCIADSVHRAGDCAARFGGEEFAVLLPGLTALEALTVAEIIRAKVERWSVDQAGVTVSIGVADLMPGQVEHWSHLVEAADKALYAAKESGRNVCVVANCRKTTRVAELPATREIA